MTRGDRVIAVSNAARDYVQEYYSRYAKDRVVVIPRGVDPEAFPREHQPTPKWVRTLEERYPQLAGRRRLLLAGRWGRRKGHAELVDLVAALRQRGLDCVGVIVGGVGDRDAKQRERVLAAAAQRGVSEFICELGQRDDMRDVYAMADVVLSLSQKPESFGRTALEALALGKPVVGYAHGGIAELLNAYYPKGAVPPEAFDALTETVAQVLEAPGRVAEVSGHRLSEMQSRTLELYSELAAMKHR